MNELYHYGVKGMKWGRRKSTISDADAAVNATARRTHMRFGDRQVHRYRDKETGERHDYLARPSGKKINKKPRTVKTKIKDLAFSEKSKISKGKQYVKAINNKATNKYLKLIWGW